MINFYHHYICQCLCDDASSQSTLAKQFHIRSKAYEAAFQTLKQQLSSKPVLAHCNLSLPLNLECDASSYYGGGYIPCYAKQRQKPYRI